MPTNKTKPKRVLRSLVLILLSIVAVISLAACGGEDETVEDKSTEDESTEVERLLEELDKTKTVRDELNTVLGELNTELTRLQAELDTEADPVDTESEVDPVEAVFWQDEDIRLASSNDSLLASYGHIEFWRDEIYGLYPSLKSVSLREVRHDEDDTSWPNESVARLSILDEQMLAIDDYRLTLNTEDRIDYENLAFWTAYSVAENLSRVDHLMESIVDRDEIGYEDIENINRLLSQAVSELESVLPPSG